MAIKKFDETPDKAPEPQVDNVAAVKASAFSPWLVRKRGAPTPCRRASTRTVRIWLRP
jgi:hypothetical protein